MFRVESDFLIERLTPDRALAEPVYKQMARRMREMVAQGMVPPGQSLPAERLLAQRLNISRSTVRRFFEELRRSNELVTAGRSGAAVAKPLSPAVPRERLRSLTRAVRENGVEPSTRVIDRALICDRTIASMLEAPSTTRFLKLTRLRLGDGAPLARETLWCNLSLAPDLEDWSGEGSAYDHIQHVCGVRLLEAEQTIEAVLSSLLEREAFELDAPQPCLLFKRRTRAVSGQIVEYSETVFRGDAFVYRLRMG